MTAFVRAGGGGGAEDGEACDAFGVGEEVARGETVLDVRKGELCERRRGERKVKEGRTTAEKTRRDISLLAVKTTSFEGNFI